MKDSPKRKRTKRKYTIPCKFLGKTYLDPKFDPAFKAFFDCEDALRDFLNAVLQLKGKSRIRKVRYNAEHEVVFRTPHKKSVKFDIYATTGIGRFLDIEMQLAGKEFFVDRTILNKAFLVIKGKVMMDRSKEFRSLSKEEREKRRYELPEIISIWLCDFDLPKFGSEYIDEWAVYSKNAVKNGQAVPISTKNRYIMFSLPHFNKQVGELCTALDKWLFLLNNAAQSDSLPSFGKVYDEALERIRVDNADNKLLNAQETNMSSTIETMNIIMAGKIVDARKKDRLNVAHTLYNMGKLTPDEISAATGVATSTIRRWKRKTV